MSRYRVILPWEGHAKWGDFYVQAADAVDTKNGTIYIDCAFRVVDAAKDMKPAKVGKGGTVPFYGETAWSDADRLAGDLWTARRFAR